MYSCTLLWRGEYATYTYNAEFVAIVEERIWSSGNMYCYNAGGRGFDSFFGRLRATQHFANITQQSTDPP